MRKPKKARASKRAPKAEKKERKPKQAGNIAFFEGLVEATGNELATAASNGIVSGDINGWIDTGVYYLNAQLSGSLHGGIPNNKIAVFAGPAAVGKTFFILAVVKHFLEANPEAGCIFFESEGAITQAMLEERGIDTKRVFIVPVSTVQEWRTQSLKVLAKYKDTDESKRKPMLFVLDSLGMLSTTKEMEDSEEGKETADMTRARLIKAAFRTLTLKLGVLKIPFLITNHTYDTQGMFATKVMSGGSGTQYSNSLNVFLGKSKDKDGDEVVGVKLRVTLKKGRLTKENTQIEVKLNYATGLDRHYGLLDLALKYDIATKIDKTKYSLGGEEGTERTIYNNPTKFFTDEVMAELEIAAGKEFKYGSAITVTEEDNDSVVSEDTDE